MEDSSGVAVLVPHSRVQQDAVFIPDPHLHDGEDQHRQQQKRAADSLIQVIEKLSKIVEKQPRRCTVSGKKRPLMTFASGPVPDSRGGTGGPTPCKRPREQREECPAYSCTSCNAYEQEPSSLSTRTATGYQCNMCRFISPTLEMLKEHLLHHDKHHSDLILTCSECQFTSDHQEELVAHVRLHLEEGDHAKIFTEELRTASARSVQHRMTKNFESEENSIMKKWYSFEQGRYHCLICNYECRQQRNLKTHAWKHAGLVDCSYPIFEDEVDCPDSFSPPLVQAGKEVTIVVLVAVGGKSQMMHGSSNLKLELCASPEVNCHGETVAVKTMETKIPVLNHILSIKDSEEPLVEIPVTPEAQMELELETESQQASSDSLLFSAQKIISSDVNSDGHVNVIVERLPCALEQALSSKPLLLSPEVAGDKTLLASEEPELESQHHHIYFKQEKEVVIRWNGGDRQLEKEMVPSGSPPDENVPPVRRRTYSESLRLHSLAAEALVAMPMRAPELSKTVVKGIHGLSVQNPDIGQRIIEIGNTSANPKASSGELTGAIGTPAALLNFGLQSPRSSRDVLVEGPSKAGISMSLLTVIERLQERSDKNTSDEDILKELQDITQSQHGSGVPRGVAGSGVVSTTEGLVEYIAGSERPYRCRLCLYSSGNKGYIKQHLRVHRQPYQCPICEHIACDSRDLECHMIHHCKARMYSCKQCNESFHNKSQLRNHERDQHGIDDISGTLTHVAEGTVAVEESGRMTDEDPVSEQSVFKCDVCDYTSSTYVGVRNHRRIHNSDKPYRCCSCDFATTNMNSLKCHMKRHPQEHQAMQLLEQYRCSLCGYVCSHPPSLKSHMWKHAGDQNYNYEQVNKAINEAISQSSRSPTMSLKSTPETGVECPYIVLSRKDQQSSEVSSATGATGRASSEGSPVSLSSSREQASGAMACQGSSGQAQAGMEYCVLLFCCCICGFESTSKEQLMEHMKHHDGDLISIILGKEQQGNQPAETSSSSQ
ncbi:zinc finger protein 507-like isoform X2 [Myxocyprinus asiaticus]|uniref:zinc finger protein 507-like isoform X2 n=1 Tax=Myxocyprinus asiaticus TaxID=70543 RepID=UPI002222D7A6|nr:zinc finger protein 507-like isoform X2 [Myxocyprinus asiaticus]